MQFIHYLFAHFLLALFVFLIGFYVCRKYPTLFGGLPVLGTGSL